MNNLQTVLDIIFDDNRDRETEAVEDLIIYVASEETKASLFLSEKAARQYVGVKKALEICVMFLTNTNTITEEAQTELVKHLRAAQLVDLADAVTMGGFAAMVGGSDDDE